MSYKTTKKESLVDVFLSTNRKRLKNYDGKFYLKDKQEFEIEFFNQHNEEIAVEVLYNGVEMPNKLVIRPGERIWLERFLDNNNKLMFETYNVANDIDESIIKNNGDLELRFYHKYKNYIHTWCHQSYWPPYAEIHYCSDPYYTTLGGSSGTLNINCYTDNITNFATDTTINKSAQKETGRITEGKVSNQELTSSYLSFETSPFETIRYKLLPYSQKMLTSDDIRKYCPSCGIRIRKKSWQFCPSCGTKL